MSMQASRRWRRWGALSALAGALVAGGCVSEPSAITGKSRSFGYSWQQELELGARADQDIVAQMGLYDDPKLQAYVDGVAQRVLEHSDFRNADTPEIYRDTDFTFRVIDSPVVNAFALPGGYVYVTRGLLAHLNNESQLAVVLGHEIGHVTARHSSRQALRAQMGQLGLIAGAIIGDQVAPDSNIGSQILDLGGTAFQLLMFRYSREAERESDTLGIKYAGLAGYAPAEGADFFESLQRMSEAEGRALPSWQSTHPDPGERAETLRSSAGAWDPVSESDPQVGTEELLQQLEGMVIGDDPRQGYRDGDTFYHPGMRFQFPIPAGWKLQNEQAMVLMGAPNNAAVLGLQLAPGADPHAAAVQAVQQAGIQVLDSRRTTINGLPATIVIADAQSQRGIVRTLAAFIGYNDTVFNFVGQAAAANFPQVQAVFERTVGGFAPLRDEGRLNVRPARLRVREVDRAAPFRELLPDQLPNEWTPQALAILNQVDLEETVPEGRRLKLPE